MRHGSNTDRRLSPSRTPTSVWSHDAHRFCRNNKTDSVYHPHWLTVPSPVLFGSPSIRKLHLVKWSGWLIVKLYSIHFRPPSLSSSPLILAHWLHVSILVPRLLRRQGALTQTSSDPGDHPSQSLRHSTTSSISCSLHWQWEHRAECYTSLPKPGFYKHQQDSIGITYSLSVLLFRATYIDLSRKSLSKALITVAHDQSV